MCGRITYEIERDDLLDNYSWLKDAPQQEPRYNIAPTDPVLTIGPDRAEILRWGIDGRKGGLFNLRAETATSKPYYHGLLLRHRVLIPASHFYEWRNAGGRRQPVAISRVDGRVLHLAGLIGRWQDRLGATILTTVPNADIAALHNRMPVVLNDDDAATWVLEEMSRAQVAAFLKPSADGARRLKLASPPVPVLHTQGPG